MHEATATIVCGDSCAMECIASGEAALIVTSPPYYPNSVARILGGSRTRQVNVAGIWSKIDAFAQSLRPVFREMARVVGDRGLCCIETKDLEFGGFRLPLAALHARLAADCGLLVRFDVPFRTAGAKPSHFPAFLKDPRVGNFRVLVASRILVCSTQRWRSSPGVPLSLDRRARLELISPLWRVAAARSGRLHAHQTPPEVVRRLIQLFTNVGDLVVDPFAGSGQVLAIARSMGRNAIGYECDPATHARALDALMKYRVRMAKDTMGVRGGR